jgi:hypothetical protein
MKEACLQSKENMELKFRMDCLCGLAVRVSGYRSRGPGSIPGITTFPEK